MPHKLKYGIRELHELFELFELLEQLEPYEPYEPVCVEKALVFGPKKMLIEDIVSILWYDLYFLFGSNRIYGISIFSCVLTSIAIAVVYPGISLAKIKIKVFNKAVTKSSAPDELLFTDKAKDEDYHKYADHTPDDRFGIPKESKRRYIRFGHAEDMAGFGEIL